MTSLSPLEMEFACSLSIPETVFRTFHKVLPTLHYLLETCPYPQSVSDSVLRTVRRRFQRTLTTGTRSRRLRRISVGSRLSLSAGFSVLSDARLVSVTKVKVRMDLWVIWLRGRWRSTWFRWMCSRFMRVLTLVNVWNILKLWIGLWKVW